MQLEDWLDDLCVRFIINLPHEELQNVERICFQVEEAQWFYEDFIRPIDPKLPSLSLKAFSLRIFQHCPIFAEWDAHHYTAAFADFMAYKSRVPVRGAIMLNDAMDKVVLVKGWKKGANWSFPRGKINKDEDDLDCAVREVYEETGLDIVAAGLVKEEKEMKSIDITMREQHMRLYVFRGVPEDTHFEPRTRKEISKIEWYKLTDLPTLKKHKHQDSTGGEHHGPSANKFYMVAPFLGPLKKWISQQRKKEARHSSNLAAPPILAEESEVDALSDNPAIRHQQSQFASDLPEVTAGKPLSPTSQLKQLFNMEAQRQPQSEPQPMRQSHMPQVDTAKSSALLSLLRGSSTAELRGSPNTPLEQTSFPPEVAHPLHHPPLRQTPPGPHLHGSFNVQSELPTSPLAASISARPMQQVHPFSQPPQFENSNFSNPRTQAFTAAPYQQTGDPEFARPQHHDLRIPPASALPKLTSHTKALLDMFSTAPSQSQQSTLQERASSSQTLLDIFKSPSVSGAHPLAAGPAAAYLNQQRQPSIPSLASPDGPALSVHADSQRPKTAQQDELFRLFTQKTPTAQSASRLAEPARVELAADPARKSKQNDDLLNLLREQKSDRAAKQQHPGSTSKEGKTSANMSGPLDQPNFEVISKSQRGDANTMGRSPLTTHRTLFDPKQPTPVKIMARPESPRQTPAKSPRVVKAKLSSASPKRNTRQSQREATKPFQPQILKRPQQSESGQSGGPTERVASGPSVHEDAASSNALSMSREASSDKERLPVSRKASQPDAHKQTLLSLFGGPSPGNIKTTTAPARVVSPLSVSQIVSPRDEVPISAIEGPMPSRSRMGSLVSVGSGIAPARPALEKRQTGAQDKAFLLGMLGKIATQQS